MATDVITPMLDAAPAAEAETGVNIPSLDDVQVDSETRAEVPAETEAKAEDSKTEAGKAAAGELSTAAAAFTPQAIAEKLSEIKKNDPALATRLHQEVKNSLEAKRFLSANNAKSFDELKTLLSKPDQTTEEFRQTVEATDELLYSANPALWDNVIEDLKANGHPEALGALAPSFLEKLEAHDSGAFVDVQRSLFVRSMQESGAIGAINTIHKALAENRVADAKSTLAALGKFVSEELDAHQNADKGRTERLAASEKATTVTVEKLRTEAGVAVDSSMNVTLGGFLRPLLQNQLKGLSRVDLESLATAIRSEAKLALGKDAVYVKEMSKAYNEMKTPAQKAALMRKFEAALKKDDFGKKLVERVCKEKYPDRFTVKPAAPKTTTMKISVNGVMQDALVYAKRPEIIRDSVTFKNKTYHASDLSTMQMMSRGFVRAKDGKTPVLVTWGKA